MSEAFTCVKVQDCVRCTQSTVPISLAKALLLNEAKCRADLFNDGAGFDFLARGGAEKGEERLLKNVSSSIN